MKINLQKTPSVQHLYRDYLENIFPDLKPLLLKVYKGLSHECYNAFVVLAITILENFSGPILQYAPLLVNLFRDCDCKWLLSKENHFSSS